MMADKPDQPEQPNQPNQPAAPSPASFDAMGAAAAVFSNAMRPDQPVGVNAPQDWTVQLRGADTGPKEVSVTTKSGKSVTCEVAWNEKIGVPVAETDQLVAIEWEPEEFVALQRILSAVSHNLMLANVKGA